MVTVILKSEIKLDIDKAVELLNNGAVAAFPTDTVFGLGADIKNIVACQEIYQIKERDGKKPLAAHVSSIAMAENCIEETNDLFYKIAEQFLPGPLAVIMPKSKHISNQITGGFETVSIRYPDSSECIELINAFGRPIAATSANISGEKSLLSVDEIYSAFNNKIGFILDGKCKYNTESTIISLVNEPSLLRRGVIPIEEIESKTGVKFRK